jgi:hypothetical protein
MDLICPNNVAKSGRAPHMRSIFPFRHSELLLRHSLARRIHIPTDMAESTATTTDASELEYVQYEPAKEEQYLPAIRQLISKDLSEPYSIYVYRYFLYQWGDLCYMVHSPCLFSSYHTHVKLIND